MGDTHRHGGPAFDSVDAPAVLTIRCQECGYRRSTLALHQNAVDRASHCERCSGANELLRTDAVHGIGCSCCS